MTASIRPIPRPPRGWDRARRARHHAHEFDPEEIARGARAATLPPAGLAALRSSPLCWSTDWSFAVSRYRLLSFLKEDQWVRLRCRGRWRLVRYRRAGGSERDFDRDNSTPAHPAGDHRRRTNAGRAAIISVASLVGFGAASRRCRLDVVRTWVLHRRRALVRLPWQHILAALTGSASGGLTIGLDALG